MTGAQAPELVNLRGQAPLVREQPWAGRAELNFSGPPHISHHRFPVPCAGDKSMSLLHLLIVWEQTAKISLPERDKHLNPCGSPRGAH